MGCRSSLGFSGISDPSLLLSPRSRRRDAHQPVHVDARDMNVVRSSSPTAPIVVFHFDDGDAGGHRHDRVEIVRCVRRNTRLPNVSGLPMPDERVVACSGTPSTYRRPLIFPLLFAPRPARCHAGRGVKAPIPAAAARIRSAASLGDHFPRRSRCCCTSHERPSLGGVGGGREGAVLFFHLPTPRSRCHVHFASSVPPLLEMPVRFLTP